MSKQTDEEYLIEHKVPHLVDDLLKAMLAERPADVVDFSVSWLKGKMGACPWPFKSGLKDCCSTNPDEYTVLAEIPGKARLVQMKVPPGGEDQPHDHPSHAMYVVNPVKLAITPYGEDGKPAGEAQVLEMPGGAAPILPAGPHQVKNVGDSEALIIFVEELPSCVPCGDKVGFKSPFEVSPTCYAKLAENDSWVTGIMEMKPGDIDNHHHHKDHLIYVLEGDHLTVYEDGDLEDESKAHAVPVKVGAGLPAPAAVPFLSSHRLKNTGKENLKCLFFEMKK